MAGVRAELGKVMSDSTRREPAQDPPRSRDVAAFDRTMRPRTARRAGEGDERSQEGHGQVLS
jgi:hypothetical protein